MGDSRAHSGAGEVVRSELAESTTEPPMKFEPASQVPVERLVRLAERIRSDLQARGEPIASDWPGEVANDLHTGAINGWVAVAEGHVSALAIFAARGDRAYGHLHLESGLPGAGVAVDLLRKALGHLAPDCQRADFGVTGLAETQERSFAAGLSPAEGYSHLEREGLVRRLDIASPPAAPSLPEGYRFGEVRTVSAETLDSIDRRAFAEGIDESLLASTPDGNRRALAGIRSGELGRFLEAASFTVAPREGDLVGFLLTVEESSRSAVFADLAVVPEDRGRGLGRALVQRGLRALTAMGYESARLWVTLGNLPARGLYSQLGFRTERRALLYRWVRPAGSPQKER